jgi:hypothetical protein
VIVIGELSQPHSHERASLQIERGACLGVHEVLNLRLWVRALTKVMLQHRRPTRNIVDHLHRLAILLNEACAERLVAFDDSAESSEECLSIQPTSEPKVSEHVVCPAGIFDLR